MDSQENKINYSNKSIISLNYGESINEQDSFNRKNKLNLSNIESNQNKNNEIEIKQK